MRIRVFDLVVHGALASAAMQLLESRGQSVRRVVILGGQGARSGPRIAALSTAESASPKLPDRVVELLGEAG